MFSILKLTLFIVIMVLEVSEEEGAIIEAPSPCSSQQQNGMADTNCSYRISRFTENEYLMIKNILHHLIDKHWNVTLDNFNYRQLETIESNCDQYFEYVAVDQVIRKDFRHPQRLFASVPKNETNETVYLQYEAEWYQKYKMIKFSAQSKKNLEQCNKLGLKLFFIMFDYVKEQPKIFKCYSKHNKEQLVTTLLDYYIAQTFLKDCNGNLELLANSKSIDKIVSNQYYINNKISMKKKVFIAC
jgi:hypothetical protein